LILGYKKFTFSFHIPGAEATAVTKLLLRLTPQYVINYDITSKRYCDPVEKCCVAGNMKNAV
jgi:hypothetical protein